MRRNFFLGVVVLMILDLLHVVVFVVILLFTIAFELLGIHPLVTSMAVLARTSAVAAAFGVLPLFT